MHLVMQVYMLHIFGTSWLVAWYSGRTSDFDQRTFPVLRSTSSWQATTYLGKLSTVGKQTTPSQPFILSA